MTPRTLDFSTPPGSLHSWHFVAGPHRGHVCRLSFEEEEEEEMREKQTVWWEWKMGGKGRKPGSTSS